jgi:hypothetical protein
MLLKRVPIADVLGEERVTLTRNDRWRDIGEREMADLCLPAQELRRLAACIAGLDGRTSRMKRSIVSVRVWRLASAVLK